MTPQEWMAAVTTGVSAFESLKGLIKMLPNPRDKEKAEQALLEAETAFHVSQAQTADELGYQLCKRHWPPIIMLLCEPHDNVEHFRCPQCDNTCPATKLLLADSIKPKMVPKENMYWTEDGDGPFCTVCWDRDNKSMRLHTLDDGLFTCHNCRTDVRTDAYSRRIEEETERLYEQQEGSGWMQGGNPF